MKSKHGFKSFIRRYYSLLVVLSVAILAGSTLLITTPGSAFSLSTNEENHDSQIKQYSFWQESELDHEYSLEEGFDTENGGREASEFEEADTLPDFNKEADDTEAFDSEEEIDIESDDRGDSKFEEEIDIKNDDRGDSEFEEEIDIENNDREVAEFEEEDNLLKDNDDEEKDSNSELYCSEDEGMDYLSLQTNEDNLNLLTNPNFLYHSSDTRISDWTMQGGNSPLPLPFSLEISQNEQDGFRDVLWNQSSTNRITFAAENTSQGFLYGYLDTHPNGTTFIIGQTIPTIPGVEYEVSICTSHDSPKRITVYPGVNTFSGSHAIVDLPVESDVIDFTPTTLRFTATVANTSIGFRAVKPANHNRVSFRFKSAGVYRIGNVDVMHINEEGQQIASPEKLSGRIGDPYTTSPKEINDWTLKEVPVNKTGSFTEEDILIQYIYELDVDPLDPLNPELDIRPENPPTLPDNQGLLKIDFVSSFNFEEQSIFFQTENYYARPQRLINENGEVLEGEERPNYVQISDRRADNNGWTLSVTQLEPFKNDEGHELLGAHLTLQHAELVSATHPSPTRPSSVEETVTLIPENDQTLIVAEPGEGKGTWIYRFGDEDPLKFNEGVMLEVPGSANPRNTTYRTTLNWQLRSVPGNPE